MLSLLPFGAGLLVFLGGHETISQVPCVRVRKIVPGARERAAVVELDTTGVAGKPGERAVAARLPAVGDKGIGALDDDTAARRN